MQQQDDRKFETCLKAAKFLLIKKEWSIAGQPHFWWRWQPRNLSLTHPLYSDTGWPVQAGLEIWTCLTVWANSIMQLAGTLWAITQYCTPCLSLSRYIPRHLTKNGGLQDVVMRVPVCICMLVTHTVKKSGQTTPTCHDMQMWLTRMLCEPSYLTNQPTKQVTKKLGTRCKLPSHIKVKPFWYTKCCVDSSDHPIPRPKNGTASWSMPLEHHDLCPLFTVQEFLGNLLPSNDPSTGKHDLTQGRQQCCVPTPVSRLHQHLYKPVGGLFAHLSS
jgi:hypothetical protein